MLGIPEELFTPIFAISRVSGWCSHRLEELVNAGKSYVRHISMLVITDHITILITEIVSKSKAKGMVRW